MKLIDLLSVISDNTCVSVINADCEVLSEYDGRNSIDEKYNECEVVEIFTNGNSLDVEIKEEF